MAHSLSSKKRIRQNEKRRLRNRARRSVLKKRVRACVDALTHKEVEKLDDTFKAMSQLLDREADRGLIHRNAAARKKSRLARRINALKAASGN